MFVEALLVTNSLQVSSAVRIRALRAFGANNGNGVTMRPRIWVKFPWTLEIGDRSWIGDGVWFHNQDRIEIGSDAVLSQETFHTTGSHRHRSDMGLIMRSIRIEDGPWTTSRCIVLGGAHVGRSALAKPMTVVKGAILSGAIVIGTECTTVGDRFNQ